MSLEGAASAPNSHASSGWYQMISLDELTLPATVSALASDDIQAKEDAAIHLRKMLCIESDPPIDAVIQSGAVPLLVDILRMGDMPQFQLEAAWALTNIVAGTSEHTKVVIDHGTLPILVELLTSVNVDVREQVLCVLGNIAGDCPAYRDLALGHGALSQLLAQFNETARISMIRIAARILSTFCGGQPQPQFDQVKDALPSLRWLLDMQDDEVLADACWALSRLSEGSTLKIQAVIDAGICPKLVELLSHTSSIVVIPALVALGNIVAGDDVQTQVVIENQVLPRLLRFLTDEQTMEFIITSACWTISNIAAGNTEHVQAVINAKIFPPLLLLLSHAELDIRKLAAWAVSNATTGGSNEQIKYLVGEGCIQRLCDLVDSPDPTIRTLCHEGLKNILRAGETEKNAGLTDVNVYFGLMKDAFGL